MMLTIAFRVDGGQGVGMGHIMRALSLASVFKRWGCKVYFFSSLKQGIQRIANESYPVICLESRKSDELELEARELVELLAKYKVSVLITDTYKINERYFEILQQASAKLVYIDDLNKARYPVDIIVNGNITGEYLNYQKYSENQLLLLGPIYNMVRAEFKNMPPRVLKKKAAEVMITTGGTDPFRLTGKFIRWILGNEKLQKLSINVLVGSCFSDIDDLISLSSKNAYVQLYSNTPGLRHEKIKFLEVSRIMLKSDLAISAGGSTLYELAACGTPALAFVMVDNQEMIVEKMSEFGIVESLGWHLHLNEESFTSHLTTMCKDYNLRSKLSSRGQNLIDGLGTERIAYAIVNKLDKAIR